MRLWALVGIVLAASTTAFAAGPVTVQDLTQTLVSMHNAGKGDGEIATALSHVQLKEQLSPAAAARLQQYLPGVLSQNQLAVLVGISAFQPATLSQPSATPPLDPAAQSALLAKTASWLTSAIEQAPALTASKVILRYRGDASSSSDSQPEFRANYSLTSTGRTEDVTIKAGIETVLNPGPRIHWGENGEMSDGGPILPLPEMFHEASSFGKLTFKDWEQVDGTPAAVFTFDVPKKKSHYAVDYCCFPNTESTQASGGAGGDAIIGAPDMVNVNTWRPFKKAVPYHGELYIDPATGAVLSVVATAELRPFDFVHAEEVRIDYGSVTVGGNKYVAPVHSITLNETVPGADTKPVVYPVRRGLITADYTKYRLAGQ